MGTERITCGKCHRKCTGQALSVGETYFHNYCFTCQKCGLELGEDAFYNKDGSFYCAKDYLDNFGEQCFKCHQFLEGEVISALGNTFHLDCFTCGHCKKFFPPGENVIFDGQDYVCEDCDMGNEPSSQQPLHQCAGCHKDIETGQALMALDQHWHPRCFTCQKCGIVLHGEYMGKDGFAFCEKDYQTEFGVICASCSGYITGKVLQAGDKHYHPQCSRCAKCGQMFGEGEEMYLQGSEIWHPQCSEMVREMERAEKEKAEMEQREAERREMDEREEQRSEAEWREAERREADRREADRRETACRETDRRETDRREADLREADRREANLREADRREADRREADLREADRREADLREADRREADRREADRRETERKDAENREADERERQRVEMERREIEAERREAERREMEQREIERQNMERREAEKLEREHREAEKREMEQRREREQREQIEMERREMDRKNQRAERGYYQGQVGVETNVNVDGPRINYTDPLPPPNFSPPGRNSPQFDDLPPPPRPEEMPKGAPAPPTRTASKGYMKTYGSLPRNASGSGYDDTSNVPMRNGFSRQRPRSYHESSFNNYEETNQSTEVTKTEQKFKTSVKLKVGKSVDDSAIGKISKTNSYSSQSSPAKEFQIFSYEDLSERSFRLPRTVNRSELERYLSVEEFQEVFKQSKDEFYAMPKWKQHDKKKSLKLF